MRDLLTLDFSALSKGLHLIGIDKDPAALRGAQALSEQVVRDNPAITIEFRAGDALREGITMQLHRYNAYAESHVLGHIVVLLKPYPADAALR